MPTSGLPHVISNKLRLKTAGQLQILPGHSHHECKTEEMTQLASHPKLKLKLKLVLEIEKLCFCVFVIIALLDVARQT